MSTPAFTVRHATLRDLAAVCALAQQLNVLHHQAWPNLFAPGAYRSIDEGHWRDSLAGTGRAGFVALKGGVHQGFVTASVADETHSLKQPMRYGRINSICIAPAAQGQGLGRALMASAEQWALSQGAVDMQLVVWAFNETAVRLYHELGYTIRSHTMGKTLSKP